MENSPVVIHQHITYQIDTGEIIHRLKRIERKVEQDTSAEETLAFINQELRDQLEALMTGENLPPAVTEKIKVMVEKIKAGNQALTKAVEDNQPSVTKP